MEGSISSIEWGLWYHGILSQQTWSRCSHQRCEVNATLDLLYTVVNGHWLASACEELGVASLDSPIPKAAELLSASAPRKLAYVEDLASGQDDIGRFGFLQLWYRGHQGQSVQLRSSAVPLWQLGHGVPRCMG